MGIKHAFVSGKADEADTSLVRPSNWNEDHNIDSEITLPVSAPSPPASGVSLFGKAIGGRIVPAFVGPSGQDAPIQPHLGRNRILYVSASHNSTAVGTGFANAFGVIQPTGITTSALITTTNLHTSLNRCDFLQGTASTTAVAGFRTTNNILFRGNGTAGVGGFHVIVRCSPATGGTVSTRRFFTGLSSAVGGAAVTDVSPSSLTNVIGAGYDSADANWRIYFRGSSTGTDIDTGIARPNTDRPAPVEIAIFCAPDSSSVSVSILLLGTGQSYSTANSTTLPSATTLLGARGYHSVGGTSSVTGYTIFSLYADTDN